MTIEDVVETWIKPIAPTYPQHLYFYKNHERSPDFMPSQKLIDGLRRTLELYPIVYGRLAFHNGQYEIRHSDKGVPLIEAQSSDDISKFEPYYPYKSLDPSWRAITQLASEDLPLLAVRITRFANQSGLVICFTGNHMISDGTGWAMLLKTWMMFVRGQTPLPPIHNRELLSSPPGYRVPINDGSTVNGNAIKRTPVIFRFRPEKLALLKSNAMTSLGTTNDKENWVSTNDAVQMLIWRACVRAEGASPDKMLEGGITINLRSFIPELSSNYFGNAFVISKVQVRANDLLAMSIGEAAIMNRRSLNSTKARPRERLLEEASIKNGKSLEASVLSWLNDIDFATTDWSKFGYYSIDFGYGNPVCCRRFMYSTMRAATILDTTIFPESGKRGLDVFVSVDDSFMDRFITDVELCSYAQLLD
ncbi:transferase [Syncephalis plumigaleata]|nr:transferase [Syncephalis plumigaleata]